jgi:phage baseplate assembly protein gpV
MIEDIVDQRIQLEKLRAAFGNSLKVGRVAQVDAQKGYRVELGKTTNGAPFLSPWLPHPESGGQSSTWLPMSEGQIVGIVAPNGNLRQGMLIRGGFGGGNEPPSSNLAANAFKMFGVELTVEGNDVVLKGNLRVEGNVDFAAGHLKHKGVNVGHDHVHKDVEVGVGLSGSPAT